MSSKSWFRTGGILSLLLWPALAQQNPTPQQRQQQIQQQQIQQQRQEQIQQRRQQLQAQPQQQQPGQPGAIPNIVLPGMPRSNPLPPEPQAQPQDQAAPGTPQPTRTTTPAGPPTVYGGLALNNASLTEVIDLLARQLKINYILDPRVKGGVILNTYGETKDIDTRSLLETILRINGFGMVQQGDLYRIVPLADISHLPIQPETIGESGGIPNDDRTMLNLVFLKYMAADDLVKVLEPFEGENARIYTFAPANLLLMLDSRRNMRRLMDLIAMFDSDQLANQRVHILTVKNGRPSDLAKELDNIVKSVALSDKNSPVKFLPIDRINTIIAVSPNPGAFQEVEKWLAKLDIPVKVTPNGTNDYVYRVRYGDAQAMACSIQALYGQLEGYGTGSMSIMACMGPSLGSRGGGGGGAFGGGGFGGGYGAGAYGAGAYGANMYGAGAYPNYGVGYGQNPYATSGGSPFAPRNAASNPGGAAATAAGGDLTGTYLGNATYGPPGARLPRVVANPMNNTLLIQATPQEYENMEKLIRDLDVPPRQVLIEAKIYSIDLTHAFSSDVQASLVQRSSSAASKTGTTGGTTAHSLIANFANDTTNLSAATLVGRSRELLGTVTLMESENRAKVLSAPSVIATDSIPASINVGTSVPTLQGSISGGIGGGTVATAVSSQSTGVTLAITARVTPSGIVTMIIDQNVSDPTPTTTSNIGSPSFANKSISTQVTVQDGDTIAIGGMIGESTTSTIEGIPLLDRIPYLGAAFGFRAYSKERSELIIFLTPHVIYDTNQMADATDELKSRVKMLRKDMKE